MTTTPLRKAPRQIADDTLAEMDADELRDHGCAYAEYFCTCDGDYLSDLVARVEALTDNATAFDFWNDLADCARFGSRRGDL